MEGPKLEWMYKNSNDIVDKEEYLLGKPIDKAFEQSQASSLGDIEKDCLPTSIFANAGSNVQVDVIRKLKEDPLEAIRQQEIERRKQLLRNPIKLKKLQNMLKVREGEVSEGSRKKKKKKKHNDEESMDIDGLLAAKYNKIMKKHGIKSFSELAQLKIEKTKKRSKKSKRKETSSSESDSSESEPSVSRKGKSRRRRSSEEEDEGRRGGRRNQERSSLQASSSREKPGDRHKRRSSEEEEEDEGRRSGRRNQERSSHQASSSREKQGDRHRRRSSEEDEGRRSGRRNQERSSHQTSSPRDRHRRSPSSSEDEKARGHKAFGLTMMTTSDKHNNKTRNEKNHPLVVNKKPGIMEWKNRRKEQLSEKEREERLKEMMDNAKWRDEVRKKNIATYRKEDEEEAKHKYSEDFMRKQMVLATSHGSVESRIKSNINNVQRSKFSMDVNFARR